MADDSELDYIKTFLEKVNTSHTVATIESTRNINMINDSQSILVYAGEILSINYNIIEKQYSLQLRDATEGALNSSIYSIINGVNKLNQRETITDYTKPNSLVGMRVLMSGRDFYNAGASWYTNIKLIAYWLTE